MRFAPLLFCVARATPAVLAALLLGACSCSEAAQLEVDGAHPYVRCHAAEVGELPERIAGARLRLRERRLIFEGAPDEVRLVAFSGPIEAVDAQDLGDADLIAVVGDVSGDRGALDALEVPVLLIGGGLDTFEALRAAESPPHVIDATGLRLVRFGPLELVPVGGAPSGRYSLEGGCGFADADVESWQLDAPEAGVSRLLLAWAAPAGAPEERASRGLERAEAGSALVSRIAEAAHASGALFAWPQASAGVVDEDGPRVALRRAGGSPLIASDGSRPRPGVTRITVDAQGVSVAADPP